MMTWSIERLQALRNSTAAQDVAGYHATGGGYLVPVRKAENLRPDDWTKAKLLADLDQRIATLCGGGEYEI